MEPVFIDLTNYTVNYKAIVFVNWDYDAFCIKVMFWGGHVILLKKGSESEKILRNALLPSVQNKLPEEQEKLNKIESDMTNFSYLSKQLQEGLGIDKDDSDLLARILIDPYRTLHTFPELAERVLDKFLDNVQAVENEKGCWTFSIGLKMYTPLIGLPSFRSRQSIQRWAKTTLGSELKHTRAHWNSDEVLEPLDLKYSFSDSVQTINYNELTETQKVDLSERI